MTAVDAAVDRDAANDGEGIEARRFDAALEVARHSLAPDPEAVPPATIMIRTQGRAPGGTNTDAPRPADALPEPCGLDASAVVRGIPISRAAYERFRCDAKFAVERIFDDGTIERTPTTDAIPRRVRRAVRDRDPGCCRWPGCGARASIHLHHIVWRSSSGPNSIDNLVSLCHLHHRAVHHRGWQVVGDANGPLQFVDKDGREADERTYRRAPVHPRALEHAQAARGYHGDPTTIATALGDRLDRTWTVNTICHNEEVFRHRN